MSQLRGEWRPVMAQASDQGGQGEHLYSVIGSAWWVWAGELLQLVGIVWIAVDVYRNGRHFGARPIRAIGLAIGMLAGLRSAWRWLRTEWQRLRHAPRDVQLSGTAAASSTGSATLTVSHAGDTPAIIELRGGIAQLEVERRRISAALGEHDRRLDDLQRSHNELAAGGVYVQARSVVLVVVGSLIATASSWLAQIDWWLSVPFAVGVTVLLWILVSPAGGAPAD
jgi:hypothetical protein